tara:strand:+ start:2721 stop:4196 length:1476 start_codon:yes stop_codon:yes gene_type:complete
MTKARDIADFKFENIVDTGTTGTKVATGTTAQRGSTTGQWRFNTTTGFFEGRGASDFLTLEPTPTVTSVDVTEVESASGGNQTFVITGTNFTAGGVIAFVGSSAQFNASTTTFNNSTQVTAVAPKVSFLNAQEPYKIKFSSASGVAGVSATGLINVDNAPNWSTSAGTLATIFDNATGTHATLSASDPEGETVTYSETGGTNITGAGLSLNSSTGVISGDPTDVSNATTVSFTSRATAGSKNTDRSFNIIINPTLDGTTSGRANTSASAIKTLTGTTTNGYYYIQASGMANPVRLWCDMNTDGGGYMRFWWFNTLEQDGGLSASWNTGTKFGTSDISTITHTQNYGYGRIPSGVTPTKLMVKGTSAQQTSSNPVSYIIFTFNSGNSTSNAMLGSMQNGTTYSYSPRDNFPPTSISLDTNPYNIQSSGMCDHWGYGTNVYSGGESTFDLNDDTGTSNTSIGAGNDGGNQGTDFVTGGGYRYRTGDYLALYWK